MLKKSFPGETYKTDVLLTITVLLLSAIGLIAVESATKSDASVRKWYVQMMATGIGGIAAMGIRFLDLRRIMGYRWWLYGAGVFLLLLVLVSGSGKTQTGAVSWLRIGPVGIQPSEPLKVLFVLVLAKEILEKTEENGRLKIRSLLYLLGVSAPMVLLVILQNDTGTALVYCFILVVMLFVAGLKMRYFAGGISVLLLLLPMIWMLLAPYQKNRILMFLHPEADSAGAGFQVLRSKLSVAGGGLFGRGFMQGVNNRLSRLPEKETDFIFSVIGEEAGFIGCTILVLLLLFLCVRIFGIGAKAKTAENRLICAGIGAMFLFHIVENICMCIGLLPVTGIPLPFISYGGSAQVTGFLAIGIVQNIYADSRRLHFYNN